MKTAEKIYWKLVEENTPITIEDIRAIQLDAARHGMTLAAGIACDGKLCDRATDEMDMQDKIVGSISDVSDRLAIGVNGITLDERQGGE